MGFPGYRGLTWFSCGLDGAVFLKLNSKFMSDPPPGEFSKLSEGDFLSGKNKKKNMFKRPKKNPIGFRIILKSGLAGPGDQPAKGLAW